MSHTTGYGHRNIRAAVVLLITIAAAACALTAAPTARAGDPSALTVWVSPAGADTNDGLTPDTPFATLQRANDWLCGSTTSCTGRGQPVIVRIAQTTIPVTSATTWRYYNPAYPTTLEPWTYQPGDGWAQLSQTGGLPTFDGRFAVKHAFQFFPAGAGSASTGLRFIYLRWQRFQISAVELHGGITKKVTSDGITVWWPTDDDANGVSFYGDYFYQIGNAWDTSDPMAWGAVDAYNSSGDTVINSHFVQLENDATDARHVHALYFSHHSDDAVVEYNEFRNITGDPVRQRDLSERTLVAYNVFTRTGDFGYADDWSCRPNIPDSVCWPKEYRSWGGQFYGNTLNGLYPDHYSGSHLAYCFDIPGGLCPSDRWNTKNP